MAVKIESNIPIPQVANAKADAKLTPFEKMEKVGDSFVVKLADTGSENIHSFIGWIRGKVQYNALKTGRKYTTRRLRNPDSMRVWRIK